MNRLLVACFTALALLGADGVFAQTTPQSDPTTQASAGAAAQTVDEGTLLERRLAASGRTHGTYRAAPSRHVAARHHGRASHKHAGHGRHHRGRDSHAHTKHGHKAHGHAGHTKASRAHSRSRVHGHAPSAHHRHR